MWEKVRLGDIATFVNGYPFKPTDWSEQGLEIIRIQNLTRSSSEVNYYKGKISDKYKITKGDILISWSATLGVYTWNRSDGWLNQHIFKVIFNKLEIDKCFFIYLVDHVLDDLKSKTHGATMKHITKVNFDNTLVPFPPLITQEKIANILNKADQFRRKDQELLDKYDRLAQSIFIDMFGDPVKNEKRWELKKLNKLCSKILSGSTPKGGSEVYVKSGIKFFRSQNVWKNRLDLDDIAFIDESTHNSMKNSSLHHKDILITKTGRINTENSSLGRAALFLGEDGSANINGHVYLIRINDELVLPEFIVFILTTVQFRDHIRSVCVGGIDKRQLNKEHIQNFPIILPPFHLQEEFAKKIEIINKLKLQTNTTKSEKLFQSLLQKAFTGELTQ